MVSLHLRIFKHLILLIIIIDEFDAYIIVSFVNATLVLSIGETVEEVTDTGFLASTPTLDVHQLGNDALLQVYIYFVFFKKKKEKIFYTNNLASFIRYILKG